MISKITRGSNFKGLLDYLFSKPGAELLGGNIVGETASELASQLEESSLLSTRVKKPVSHISLSIPPTDKLEDVDWLDIAAFYLKAMGYECNQYTVIRHSDREHDHIHIAACKVRIDTGKCVDDDWDYRRSEAVVKKLEEDYNLTPSPSSQDKDRRSPTTGERRLLARTGEDSVRVKLQDTIDELCSQQPTMPELIDLLKDQGIDVQVKETVNGSMGISYKLDEIAFTGSKLGRAYTFNGLQKYRNVEYDPEHDNDAIAFASSRPPVMTSQNSSTTDSTEGDDDDNETIGAIAPSNQEVELPGQLPLLPELELELESDKAANSDNDDETATASSDKTANKDDEKLNYTDLFAVPDDFDKEFLENRAREIREQVREKQAAEQARRTAEAIEYRRAEEQRINNIYKENINNPIFNELIPDEVKALFEESIARENMGANAPNELQLNDATAPLQASNLTHETAPSDLSDQTAPSVLSVQHETTNRDLSVQHETTNRDLTVQHETTPTDLTVPTVPTAQTELDQDDEEVINVDPIEENWEPLRSHLIEQYCLPPSLLDALHETERLYANVDGMAVFSLRTLDNIETGVWVLNPSTEEDKWVDLILEPEVEEEVNGEPAIFWISSLGDAPNDKAIITQDPIETISYVALDPSFEQNNTIYISAFGVDSLPIKSLQQLKSNVVVSFKGDEEGIELRNELAIALPKSQKMELDEAGWNGMLKERSQQVEQIQLMAQYQSQQESQMEL
ncbi:Relaxase/mobilization nuclease family protein (plasmid) [Crinalium epipsammum PCC 9333]|uniref:Relaxase/mobilization nuclease family protein n=1 Tax=Crinalium epipsammum PCC 9333 TaxID=1173022 RepID=K9W654_9CYAN|nr:relaxase/mobilization nuclease domain-containing protein [Crinalium epipsammum]AFZ15656.1 Relaxase/mobilization nuclease family protein [Crinalium epipsammum PCC 9333]